jgi:tRNA pseudouridine38-40 synthase
MEKRNSLRNIKLTIAYDGTDYGGWQRQKDQKTIQGTIEDALRKISMDQEIKLYGSGRTDAGVHAIGQVANFKTITNIPTDNWVIVLNNLLPKDIRVRYAEEVKSEFHARYSAVSRVYNYIILNETSKRNRLKVKNIFLSRYCYIFDDPLNIEKMIASARYLLGYHDFSAFGCINEKKSELPKNKKRNIKKIAISKNPGSIIKFTIEADAFLYKMVRLIIGTLLDFSISKKNPVDIIEILKNRDNQKSGKVVPPNGLYLTKVKY